VKELGAAATRKLSSESGRRPTSATRHSQRWYSTDDDYLPDRPNTRSDLQSRSRTHADLGSRSRVRADPDSRSSVDSHADGYSLSTQRRCETEAVYRRQRSSVGGCDNDDDVDDVDVRNGLRRAKTDLDRSLSTRSPRE